MDESLFTTRQLTEYRKWPTGDKGCLFYVAEAPLGKECAQGAVYLIDSQWRDGDDVGAYNTLHQSEIKSLPTLRPVIKGFAALLLTQESKLWIENRLILNRWWQMYYEWCQDNRPQSGFETEYVLQECLNWTLRAKDILTCFFYTPDMKYHYRDAVMHVIRDVFFRNTESVDMVMRTLHPSIRLSGLYTNQYIQYECVSNCLKLGTKVLVYGMQAIILHFAAVRRTVQEIGKGQNIDKIAEFLVNHLSDSPQNTLSLDDIRIPEYDIQSAKKLYDFSWRLNKNRIEMLHQHDLSFEAMSEQEQQWEIANGMLMLESEQHKNDQLIAQLASEEERQKMQSLITGYFIYLYKKLKKSPFEADAHQMLENMFPDLFKQDRVEDIVKELYGEFVPAQPVINIKARQININTNNAPITSIEQSDVNIH